MRDAGRSVVLDLLPDLSRIVASFVILEGIAFLAIVTAAITSTFVTRAARTYEAAHEKEEPSNRDMIEARLDQLDRKLDGLAATLAKFTGS